MSAAKESPFAGMAAQTGGEVGGEGGNPDGSGATEETAGPDGALFPASDYDDPELQLPKIDGKGIDKIKLKLTGSIELDRSDVADVAFWRDLRVGKEVELRVAAKVTGLAGDEGSGEDEQMTGTKALKVGTVYVLSPEEM